MRGDAWRCVAKRAAALRAHTPLLDARARATHPPTHPPQVGVLFGLAATIGGLDWPMANYVQLAGVLGGGGGLGYMIAQRVDPTSLPQTVAAFHSLVGLAAVFTGMGV